MNHDREVPYRLIRCDKDKSVGYPDAGDLLVQGDNLLALKALLPNYVGKGTDVGEISAASLRVWSR